VRAENAGGESDWRYRTFTTVPEAPGAPALTSPAAGAVNVSTGLVLQWDAASGRVDDYRIEWKASGESWSQASRSVRSARFRSVSGLSRSMTYDWRVRAENAGGTSDWQYRSFTTVPEPPGTVSLDSPADSSVDVPRIMRIYWSAASGRVDLYRVEWKRSSEL